MDSLQPFLSPETSILEAAKLMMSEKQEIFVSGRDGTPTGVVRYLDIVKAVANGMPLATPVKQVMLKPPPMVEESATLEQVSKAFERAETRRVLVKRGREVIGFMEAGELFGLLSASLKNVEVFKAVSARARVRIAELLSVKSMGVEELSEELGIRPITVRHHIDVLRRNGIVEELQQEQFGKVGRPLSLFKTTQSVLKRSLLSPGSAT